MLKPAFYYQDKLQEQYSKIVLNEKYKYYNISSWWNYEIKLDKSCFNNLEMVSIKNDNVIGFLAADIDRDDNSITSLKLLNFYDKNITFSKDLREFLFYLINNFRKISFSVVIGNPAEKMYDKYIKKYGGRVIGVREKHVKLQDFKHYDYKLYEILRENYLKNITKT